MTGTEIASLNQMCELIKQDMERDVREFEGQPFTGRAVATMHGNLAAAISALAHAVQLLEQRIGLEIEQHCENCPHIYADGSTY